MHWVFFVLSIVVAYTGIAIFGQLSGGSSHSALSAFLSTLRPLPLFIVTVANMFFGLGLYYGFGLTRFAIPAAIALGVVTSFIYSVFILGAEVTLLKLGGAGMILLGVLILAL